MAWMIFDDDHRIVSPVVFTQEHLVLKWLGDRCKDYGMQDYSFKTSRDEDNNLELIVTERESGKEYPRAYYLRNAEII